MTAPSPSVRPEPNHPLLAHLGVVDALVASIARRHALDQASTEEFGSWVRERLMEDDCAIIRKFSGRSSIRTYLTVVITRLFADYRNQHWGRWRPSAAALRLGPLAVKLERLVYRDGHPAHEAIALLTTGDVATSQTDLQSLLRQLPARVPVREVSLDAATDHQALGGPTGFWETERERARHDVAHLLRAVTQELPEQERVILRMHYWEEATVAEIARALGLDQKRLYRQLGRIHTQLREALTAAGVGADAVQAVLEVEEQV
ncbi:MAG: sigma-70 family RNA polymerase sigma factor [Gemmatimonadales bacterium]